MMVPRYRFSWVPFPDSFLKELLNCYGITDGNALSHQELCELLAIRVKRPNRDFVARKRNIIEDNFLLSFPGVIGLAESLRSRGIGPGSQVDNTSQAMSYLKSCRNCMSYQEAVASLLIKIGEGEIVAMSAATEHQETGHQQSRYLNLTESVPPVFHPYQHQNDAWEALNHFITNNNSVGKNAGLLLMPTGSGKTATTVTWLLKKMVSQGARVLWLTHRHQLIDQAANEFYRFGPLAYNQTRDNRYLKLACVSSFQPKHCLMSQLGPEDEIMICSIASVYHHLDRLPFILGKGPLVVVVDEAHHTPAYTYRKVLDCIKSICPKRKLIGLTATPTRMVEDERKVMFKYFEGNCIYQVTLPELISKKILAKPIYKTIQTEQNFEIEASPDDKSHFAQYGELSERMLSVVADSKARNSYIVKEYLDNRETYGKTLIFAINQVHCVTLCEEFEKKGISCGYVISRKVDNSETIDKFKHGSLDILINVQIMTEGADVPDIQSVFITRPTRSEGLVMQMVGRGLRGPQAGGTDIAYIVDFEDNWNLFKGWLRPEIVIEPGEDIPLKEPEGGSKPGLTIPVEVILSIYDILKVNRTGFRQEAKMLIPDGWYSVVNDNNEERRVMVFPNQFEGYHRMADSLERLFNVEDVKSVIGTFFTDIDDPLPQEYNMGLILTAIRRDHEMPLYYTFKERDILDVCKTASEMFEQNMPPQQQIAYIKENYEKYPVLAQLFDSYQEYYKAILRCFSLIIDPENSRTEDGANPVFFTPEPQEWMPGPCYDLQLLFKKVLNEHFPSPQQIISDIIWSRRPMKSVWGFCRYSDRRIVINSLMDSPDIPQQVLEFVIYHELLHAIGHWNHDKEFHRLEHVFPDWAACGYFLNTFFGKFDVQ